MPDKNAPSLLKPDTRAEIAKLANNTYWRIGIFLSLLLAIQVLGLSKPTHAGNLTNSLFQPLAKMQKGLGSLPKQPESRFFPSIFNLIAFFPQSPSATPRLEKEEESDLEQISNEQGLYLADNQPLTKPQTLIHQVKQGDTITNIAREYQVSSDELIELNQIQNSNIIVVGQRLQIPVTTAQGGGLESELPAIANSVPPKIQDTNATKSLEPLMPKTDVIKVSQPKMQPADTLLSSKEDPYIANLRAEIDQLRAQYRQERAEKGNTSSATPISLVDQQVSTTKPNFSSPQRNLKSNQLKPDALALRLPPLSNSEEYLPSAFDGYTWPAEGVLTSGYGWRWGRLHQGIDIAAPIGTPIVAAASGEVVNAGWHGGYGNLIKLEHLDGSSTIYAHNNRILVSHGQKVKQGEQIAEMGSTGNSTGSHLHFEIHLRNQEVANPLALLGSR